ncbi:MAG: O-methyltransferase [Chloroflexota bacterium]|jgi:predicted O-methyltransferase YrrM
MDEQRWAAVDDYTAGLFIARDEALESALAGSAAAGLPEITVSPVQGKLLMLLAQATGARHILEIGTLGGYSTIWLARALPEDGRLITLEYSPLHAEVARRNIDGAGLGGKVEVRVGRAQDTLRLLVEESLEPFDLIFIDADKQGYPEYLKWSLQLSRSGTVIIADNVVRNGEVIAEDVDDPIILGIRRFNELLAAEPRVSATILQVVGSKGYDGLAMALVQ